MWQRRHGKEWWALPNSEDVERDFCNPVKTKQWVRKNLNLATAVQGFPFSCHLSPTRCTQCWAVYLNYNRTVYFRRQHEGQFWSISIHTPSFTASASCQWDIWSVLLLYKMLSFALLTAFCDPEQKKVHEVEMLWDFPLRQHWHTIALLYFASFSSSLLLW